MKSLKSASILKGAKRSWKGKSSKGNNVRLYTKKGVAGIRVTTYRTRNGGRALVTTKRVYRLGR